MMLAMFAGKNREDWDDLLPAVMMAYRSSVHESTGFSPYRLMIGEECTLPLDIGLPKQQSDLPDSITSPYAIWVRDALEVAYEQVRQHSGQAVQRQKRSAYMTIEQLLGQLWRYPVEWCAVWKGSVRECRDHFNDKHSGSATLDFEEESKSFPSWTVTREFWEQALKPEISGIAVDVRLFHESGRRLVHRYWVYRDPLPHPALREGRITKLLSFVNRAMVIAQLTHLRIVIPSSGNPPGEVPSDCFPKMTEPSVTKIQSTTGEMDLQTADQDDTPADSPMTTILEEKERPKAQETQEESIVPLPGFRPFQWPHADWEDIGDATLDPGLYVVASWKRGRLHHLSYRSHRSQRRTPWILLWCK